MTLPRALKHAFILGSIAAAFLFLVRASVIDAPYGYDEADYMYAVSLGLAANLTDTPTLGWGEFIQAGLTRGKNAGQRTELSEMIRASNDVVFYRHWHGPLYTGWLRVAKVFASSEHAMRFWNYLFPIVTAMLMYFGALWLLPGRAGQIAAILGAVLMLWSFPVINSSELAPHEMFVLFVVAALLSLGALMSLPAQDPRKYWYAAVVASALAFCTLEVAFALIATVLICGHAVRDRLKPDLAFAGKSLGAFAATVFIAWPAAIYKLSFVKAYLFMAYLAVFRKGAWGTNVTVAETWWLRFVTSPVPWTLLVIAGALLISRRVAWPPVLLPFAVYAVSMALAILRVNTDIPRYVLPLYPAIVLLSAFTMGIWLESFDARTAAAITAILCAATFLTCSSVLASRRPRRDPNAFALLDQVRQNGLESKTLLVPQVEVPTVHYYFPHSRIMGYRDKAEIATQLRAARVDALCYDGSPARCVLNPPAPLP